jgi:hypothetical protein
MYILFISTEVRCRSISRVLHYFPLGCAAVALHQWPLFHKSKSIFLSYWLIINLCFVNGDIPLSFMKFCY